MSLGDPAAPIIDLAWDGDERYRRIHSGVSVWQSNPIQIIEAFLAEAHSPFDDVTADLPFLVHGMFKSDDTAQHRRLLSCAPVDGCTSLVTSVVWTSSSARVDDAKVVGEAMADLGAVKSAVESESSSSSTVEITSGDEECGSADWKRRLLAFAGQGVA